MPFKARNKLQDENQSLRDKLYDAEMMIRYLQLKLIDYGDKEVANLTKNAKTLGRETRRKALKSKVENALQWQPKATFKSQAKRKISKRRQKTFTNDVAPGKKTFITPTEAAKLTSDESSSSCSPTGFACSKVTEVPPFNFNKETQSRDEKPGNAERSSITAKTIQSDASNVAVRSRAALKNDSTTANSEDKMVSVIGKLAEVVISEYS